MEILKQISIQYLQQQQQPYSDNSKNMPTKVTKESISEYSP